MHSRYMTIDGYRLHLLEAGVGPAVLLLRGRATGRWRWTG